MARGDDRQVVHPVHRDVDCGRALYHGPVPDGVVEHVLDALPLSQCLEYRQSGRVIVQCLVGIEGYDDSVHAGVVENRDGHPIPVIIVVICQHIDDNGRTILVDGGRVVLGDRRCVRVDFQVGLVLVIAWVRCN